MASTSFITEAGHVPSSATAGSHSTTTTSIVTSSGARFNSNSNSNRPNSSDSPTTKFTTGSSNNSSLKDRSNSLRHKQHSKSGSDPTSTSSPKKPSPITTDHNGAVLHTHRQNHNSSKLPAFRFADLKKDALVRPTLLQHQIPPSPVSPTPAVANPDRRTAESCGLIGADEIQTEARQRQQEPDPQRDLHDVPSPPQNNKPTSRNRHIPASPPESQIHNRDRTTEKSSSASRPHTEHVPQLSPPRIRASTFQATSPSKPSATTSTSSKRPSSLPESPAAVANLQNATPTAELRQHQAPALSSPEANGTPSGKAQPRRVASDSATKDWAQGQRELLLPKTVDATKSDDKRRSRPPVSFRPPHITSAASPRAVIPPIRGFRSSGSRKSLVLDMNPRRVSYDGSSDGSSDPNHRDRTLRALEGRTDDDYSQMTPPDSAEATPDEHTADIFMRIAREDSTPRSPRDTAGGDEHSAITRLTRSTQRRPFSAAVPSHQVSSPPQVTRRLSDQRETSRTRRIANEQSAQQMTRELNYRGIAKEQPKASLGENYDEPVRTAGSRATTLRPSPITPRTLAFHDSQSEVGSWNSRRRPSLTESNGGLPSRASQLRNANAAYGQGRTYNSSPLAPRAVDLSSHHPGDSHGMEGTESSASTAAPSMIWDELDEMKSRIHRLELTRKPAATSAAAMSRMSDERPATAVTNATSMSASPKRGAAGTAIQAETGSATSSQREQQPIVLSALSKTKDVVRADVYSALDSMANDALSLVSMMGAPGQPGPISSGASTIGGGGSVTDRQLRRKAEGILRSLTELCLALTEETPDKPGQITLTAPAEQEAAISPTASRFNHSSVASQRRPSALTDQTMARLNPTPRAPSTLDHRRTTLLTSTPLASPRYAALPGTPTDAVGRKSSLLVARRRAGTEEPEEQAGRKSSLLLRTRRAGTEEPEEGRKTSLLLRARRGTNDDDEEESRFRAPSRAATEVNSLRAPLRRDYASPTTNQQDPSGAAVSSALPRRRLAPSSLGSRLVAPSSPASLTPTTAARRFLDRSTPERDTSNVADKLAEDRGQRQFSLSQTAMMNRTSSLSRRRDSHIPSLSSPSSQQASVYR